MMSRAYHAGLEGCTSTRDLITLPNDTNTQPTLEFDVLNPRAKRGT